MRRELGDLRRVPGRALKGHISSTHGACQPMTTDARAFGNAQSPFEDAGSVVGSVACWLGVWHPGECVVVGRNNWCVLLLCMAACRELPPTVTIDDECSAQYGMSCDWLAALDAAATHPCSDELERHWSAEVRRVCGGGDLDRSIAFGHFDVHFPEHGNSVPPSAVGTGGFSELETDPEALRRFRFGAQPDGQIELSSDRYVSAVVETRIGVLVGLDAGEWGGALVWVPRVGAPALLLRQAVSHVFEQQGEVYLISHEGAGPGRVLRIDREGRSSRWRIDVRFVLPGNTSSVWRANERIFIVTDAGVVVVHDLDRIEVLPSIDESSSGDS